MSCGTWYTGSYILVRSYNTHHYRIYRNIIRLLYYIYKRKESERVSERDDFFLKPSYTGGSCCAVAAAASRTVRYPHRPLHTGATLQPIPLVGGVPVHPAHLCIVRVTCSPGAVCHQSIVMSVSGRSRFAPRAVVSLQFFRVFGFF